MMAQAHFPDAARPAPGQPAALLPTGRLYVSVQVRPNGSVRQPPRITRRELARPTADYPRRHPGPRCRKRCACSGRCALPAPRPRKTH
ncbi:MAG: hypothetical protein WKG07_30070 [Hymenobacter sp.]